jgi:hypothetical protein
MIGLIIKYFRSTSKLSIKPQQAFFLNPRAIIVVADIENEAEPGTTKKIVRDLL